MFNIKNRIYFVKDKVRKDKNYLIHNKKRPLKQRIHKYVESDKTKFLFRVKNHFEFHNWRFKISYCKWNPPRSKLHLQIWTPLIMLMRDNSKWEIGNKNKLIIYHE